MKKAFLIIMATLTGLATLALFARPAAAQQQKGGREPLAWEDGG